MQSMKPSTPEQKNLTGIAIQPGELLALSGVPRRFPPPRRLRSLNPGRYVSRIRGRGMEFDEVRLYQPGDDARSIDWRVTARSGKPHTKLFHEELERPVLLVIDGAATLRFGTRFRLKSVQACRFAAVAAWAAFGRGDRVGMVLAGPEKLDEIRPASRHAHLVQSLQRLTEWHNRLLSQPAKSSMMLDAMRVTRSIAPHGSLIYLISDWAEADDDYFKAMGPLYRHHDLRAVLVQDPLEEQLPESGLYPVIQNRVHSAQHVNWLDCSRVELRQMHAQRFRKRIEQLGDETRRLGVPLLRVSTNDNIHRVPLH